MADDTADRVLNRYDYEDPQRDLTRSRPQGNPMHDPEGLPDIGWNERRQRADKAAKGRFDDITHDTRRWMHDSANLASMGLSTILPAAYEAYYDTAHPVTQSEQSTGRAAFLLGAGSVLPAATFGTAGLAPRLFAGTAPGGIRAGRTMAAAYAGGPGLRSRVPELLDAEVKGYDKARQAYGEAVNQYPTRFNQRLRLRREMGPPAPMERGMRDPNGQIVRSRAGQDLIRMQREFPPPQPPTRPTWAENSMAETRVFPRSNNAPNMSHSADAEIDRMLGLINQSQTIPTGVAGTVLGGGAAAMYDPESRKLLGERQDHRFDKPMKVGPGPKKWVSDEELEKAYEGIKNKPAPASQSDNERWRLDQPEAEHYRQERSKSNAGKYLGYGASGVLGAATVPLAYGSYQIMKNMRPEAGIMQMLNPEFGPFTLLAGVPLATAGGSYLSGKYGAEQGRRAKSLGRLLDANYSRSKPPMSQEATTDDWAGPQRNIPYADEGDLPPLPKGAGRTGSW